MQWSLREMPTVMFAGYVESDIYSLSLCAGASRTILTYTTHNIEVNYSFDVGHTYTSVVYFFLYHSFGSFTFALFMMERVSWYLFSSMVDLGFLKIGFCSAEE